MPVLCIAVVPLRPLGADAVSGRTANVVATARSSDRDPAAVSDAAAGGRIKVLDFVDRAVNDPERPYTEPITLVGFVVADPAVPDGFVGDRLTTDPIEWSTGQEPFAADLTIWAVGHVRPNNAFIPPEMLDEQGFVRVDEHLRVPGHPNVYAVGDIAASDPHRSSARNWGYLVVARNIKAQFGHGKPRRYKCPPNRWGSIAGLQDDGMTVFQPNGKAFTVPKRDHMKTVGDRAYKEAVLGFLGE